MKKLIIAALFAPVFCFAQANPDANQANPCENGEGRPKWCDLNVALPVTVTSFNAKVYPFGVVLNWETANEKNHAFYIVERSADARKFEPIGQTTGHTITDRQPEADNYYRLVSVDLDGTRNYYKVIYAKAEPVNSDYLVYNTTGGFVGRFARLSDIPKNQLLVINTKKQILK